MVILIWIKTHPSFWICYFLWTKYDEDSHYWLLLNPLGFAINFGERWAHVAQVGSRQNSLRPGVVWLRISLPDICHDRHDRRWCTFFKPVYIFATRTRNFGRTSEQDNTDIKIGLQNSSIPSFVWHRQSGPNENKIESQNHEKTIWFW